MAILQYKCPACGNIFDEYVKTHDEEVLCPACGKKAEREWAGDVYSATGTKSKKCSGHCATCSGCK